MTLRILAPQYKVEGAASAKPLAQVSSKQHVPSLQFLRGVAASMVLYYHASVMVSERAGYGTSITNGGAAGVDMFFVISGFVIFLVAHRGNMTPAEFLVRRVLRVGPPYWFFTSVTVALLFVPGAYQNLRFDPVMVLSSYFFLLSAHSSGEPGTVLGVGWTIAFEMYFYVLFTFAMVLAPKSPLRAIGVVIVVGAASMLVVESHPAVLTVMISTMPLEFLSGCILARLYVAGRSLPTVYCWPLIAVSLAAIWAAGYAEVLDDAWDPERVVFMGLPSLALVFAVTSLDARGVLKFHRLALFIGNSSYSLYLCHQFILFALAKAWLAAGLEFLPSQVLLVVAIAVCLAGGSAAYLCFERPVTRWLQRVAFGLRAPSIGPGTL